MNSMGKRDHYFEAIEQYKVRYRKLTTEQIRKRLALGLTIKEALVAYHQILEERGEKL
jgi:hypothetical protein